MKFLGIISVLSYWLYFVSIQTDLVGATQISSLIQRIKVSSSTNFTYLYL